MEGAREPEAAALPAPHGFLVPGATETRRTRLDRHRCPRERDPPSGRTRIAIRNGIYQNQVGNAAKNANAPAAKTANLYGLAPGGSSASVNSLLSRRRTDTSGTCRWGPADRQPSRGLPAEAAGPAPTASPLSTLSLDRRTFLRQKQSKQLQASDKTWVRADLRRGCIHVHDWLTPSYPRPVLCTCDTTAKEVAARLEASKAGAVLRLERQTAASVDPAGPEEAEPTQAFYQDTKLLSGLLDEKTTSNSSSEICLQDVGVDPSAAADSCGLYSGSDLESSTCEDFSPGGPRSTELQDSAGDSQGLATDSSAPSLNCDSATEGPDPFESSSDELDLTASPTRLAGGRPADLGPEATGGEDAGPAEPATPAPKGPSSSQARPLTSQASARADPQPPRGSRAWPEPIVTCPSPALFVQLHGGTVRRLADHERPLQILNEYLSNLGYQDPWRVQGEGLNPEIGCLIRFYFGENLHLQTLGFKLRLSERDGGRGPPMHGLLSHGLQTAPGHSCSLVSTGKPRSVGGAERVQLSGVFNVRKGKLALPVNRWSKRQVTLSGTCLIVSSVKHAHTGKMHILPLIGGKVEEVRRHSHCLAFSAASSQSQTYYVSYDSYTEHLRWLRTASKVPLAPPPAAALAPQPLTGVSLPDGLPEGELGGPVLLQPGGAAPAALLQPGPDAPQPEEQLHVAAQRFCKLRSLSLSNNALAEFPLVLCDMSSLSELNLSGNQLSWLPAELGTMHSVRTLLLDGNLLDSLPAELGSLEGLAYLGLSFNRFSCVPPVLEKLRNLEKLCLAGNQLSALDVAELQWLSVRQVDLRLNRIQTVTGGDPEQLLHLVHLDVRDAGLQELDVRPLCRLELLRCDRNSLTLLRVSGHALKSLHASHNELKLLEVQPVPETLTDVDLSWNQLRGVPEGLCDGGRMEVLDISHNRVEELPTRLMSSRSLRKLLAGWNRVTRLAERVERSQLEVLDLQHNHLTDLPHNLFIKAQSLRHLNASANRLESLPAAGQSEESCSSLEELYLTNNSLTDMCVPLLSEHARLRVLHLAYNQLQSFTASKLARLEQLEELDLSGNRLRCVPTTVLGCRRLHTLSAHSNCICTFPEVLQLPDIKCVDLSCNELSEVTLPEVLPARLQELDLTGNPRLNLDHKSLELLNNIRCFRVDPSPSAPCVSERHGAPAVWSHGYTEASSAKNKLCVAALALDSFCGVREALYGVFDGDKNVEVPNLLQCTMGDVLAEELDRKRRQEDYMTSTFLTMQRKLGTAGQRMGGSAALCHIRHDPVAPSEHGGCFTLKAASVGWCQAVLCRAGRAVPLSLTHTVKDEDEYLRVRRHNAVITEDNKVGGVSGTSRILGYTYLCPSVSPRPHVSTLSLTPQDEFFLLGSRGLWDFLSPDEAVEAVRNVPDALAAAKKLVSLAQSYGCCDSLSAVVVQLSITQDCCCFCEPPPPPPSPGPAAHSSPQPFPLGEGVALPAAASSELSSEFSTSEMSSEVGSTASSEEPPSQPEAPASHVGPPGRAGARRAGCRGAAFQRQLSGALSDNGADSEDEEPLVGVFSNGSRVEVEADVHCLQRHDSAAPLNPAPPLQEPPPFPPSLSPAPSPVLPSSPALIRREAQPGCRARANGSVACQGQNQDLIEEAADVPVRKQGGYFSAPAQPDPDDQLIVPPELEEEVRQIIQQQQQQQQHEQM
ncbi:unnamed protein product, partial [Tetraodon nigroviridis]